MSARRPVAVLVEWVDHRFDLGEATPRGPILMVTFGWLLEGSNGTVRVATTYAPEDGTYHDVYTLDARLVRRIRRVPASFVHRSL